MPVWVAFHKGYPKGHRGSWLGRMIKRVLDEPFPHVELVLPKEGTIDQFPGKSFSSRGSEKSKRRGGVGKGVKWKKINYSHRERWIIIRLPGYKTLEQIKALKDECQKFIGKKYDYLGALAWCGLKKRAEWAHRWWCSEVIARVIGVKPWRLTPFELYRCCSIYIREQVGQKLAHHERVMRRRKNKKDRKKRKKNRQKCPKAGKMRQG